MSVDPGIIRAEAHAGIGSLIERGASVLIERWSKRAAEDQPKARRVHHQVLLNHLSEFLRGLGRSLGECRGPEVYQHFPPATFHGEQRWEAGWSLLEVVRDFQILRLVVLDYLEETLNRPLSYRETMAIGLALDDAIAASITRYSDSRDGFLREVSERRLDVAKQAQDQLQQQADALREVDRRKNEFLATLGHELRNPLAPLWNCARVLEMHELTDPALVQTRNIIRRQVQQLARLVDDLLDISRIAQGRIELRREHVDLASVVAQAAQTSAAHVKARHHQFEVSLPAAPIWLEADPVRVVQIIVNLLNNAAKYTEPGGVIWLTAEGEGSDAVIRVRDTGIGIPPEMLPHVFDLFTQVEWETDRSQGGLGIGLALVRRLVELHGGTISARSAGRGKGSEFVVRLPALPAPPPRALGTPPDREAERRATVAQRRILVVDDNVDSAVTLGILLKMEGHEIQLAHDGQAALQAASAHKPEIVLLDIGMPRMDGYEVARRLRQQPLLEKTFLVALTGYGQDEDRRRSQECGFDAHLVKPVDLDALRDLLNQCGNGADEQKKAEQ
jgi:signal transduction histidine kinase/ActR/RegA family two-component response regulator